MRAKRTHHTHRKSQRQSARKPAVLLLLTLALVAGIAVSGSKSDPFTSAEVHFADASPGGLQIVPASCASNPHWSGECSMPSTCQLTINGTTAQTIAASPNGTLEISWAAPYPPDAYDSMVRTITGSITGIGAVYLSGTLTVVAPQSSITYTYSGEYKDYTGAVLGSFSCSVPVTVSDGSTDPLYITKVEINHAQQSVSGGTVNYEPVTIGDTIVYRMCISNLSQTQAQTSVQVQDAIPTNTHLTWQGGGTDTSSASAVGSPAGTVISWTQNTASASWGVSPPCSAYVEFSVQVDSGTQICNTATVSSTEWPLPVSSNTVCNPVYICTTALPSAVNNSSGYEARSAGNGGTVGKQANINTSPICVRNNSTHNYFVPANTPTEIDSFKAHLPPGAAYDLL